ncbi:fungal-specific transcription factor domain-containing protein [Xylogone sp. PMI_703]|nr:fungal-specific transcription factor domain-containing protein [Xylogone sp. PMI_703]
MEPTSVDIVTGAPLGQATPIDTSHSGTVETIDGGETAACQSCRRRKLKCSREVPVCSQCVRLKTTCLYDRKRQKPGIKSGAIEGLNQRLEALERILLENGGNPSPNAHETNGCLYHAALLLAREHRPKRCEPLLESDRIATDGEAVVDCGQRPPVESVDVAGDNPRKRKRKDDSLKEVVENIDEENLLLSLPSMHILKAAVDCFFSRINHWIPFLHPPRFKAMMDTLRLKPGLGIILHAIVSTTMKYMRNEYPELSISKINHQIKFSRNAVKLMAMDSLTIEGIQALIIIAFDYIGSGQVSKAWPIIGSLTRTVEYLQLTVEPDAIQEYSLSSPLSLLNSAADWTEAEHRRRTFWNVFLLDRFCSLSTGWSTSLTSDDVHRRLPCDWTLWHNEEPVMTPYFGIWNKAAAKIGNSIAYIPSHYPDPEHVVDSHSPISNSELVDASKLGAFAYCIEATESLSQVTMFFLQQRVNLRSSKEVTSWLTRFKELDLRLVHWKMFLPQKWKDSDISRDSSLVNMDPNLTLAHITHNTSMILLHQHIAYPAPQLTEMIELPSSCSAETCRLAAVETASITKKYLKHTKVAVVNSQFALCAFVAARILLVRWRLSATELLPEFFYLVEGLEIMSNMWRGELSSDTKDPSELDLAGMYALHLRGLHEKCSSSPHFRMDPSYGVLLPPLAVPKWSTTWHFVSSPFQHNNSSYNSPQKMDDQRHNQNASDLQPKSPLRRNQGSVYEYQNAGGVSVNLIQQPQSIGSYGPPFFEKSPSMNGAVNGGMNGGIVQMQNNNNIDELAEMSNTLLGQQFLGMDRVISLDDTDFVLNFDTW